VLLIVATVGTCFGLASMVLSNITVAAQGGSGGDNTEPALTGVTDKTTSRLTNCWQFCVFRNILEGDRHHLVTISLHQTGSPPEVSPTHPYLTLQGDHSGETLVLSGPIFNFTASGVDSAPDQLTVDLGDHLNADHYSGAVVAGLSSGTNQLVLPVDLQVRDDPLWPTILLLISVGAGALITLLFNQRPKAQFRSSAEKLGNQINALPESERDVLVPLWNRMWDERASDFMKAQSHLTALTAGMDALRRCRDIQDRLPDPTRLGELTNWYERVRIAILEVTRAVESFAVSYDDQLGLVTQATQELAEAVNAEADVENLEQRARGSYPTTPDYDHFVKTASDVHRELASVSSDPTEAAPDLERILKLAHQAFDKIERETGVVAEAVEAWAVAPAVGPFGVRARAGLARPRGSPPVHWDVLLSGGGNAQFFPENWRFDVAARAAGLLWPAAGTVVGVLLLAIGFKTTYLDNAIFGSSWSDWLALVIWGLAAYGARQTLTGFGASAASTK